MTASVASHPNRISVAHLPVWASVAALVAVVVALSAYLAVTLSSTASKSTPARPVTNVQNGGSQYNQLCAPAPSTRFC